MATTRTPDAKRLELSVSNFGPIAEGTVELRPFTVFVGPSNTGKSYLATLIYALHRFFSSYDKAPINPRVFLQGGFLGRQQSFTLSQNDIVRLHDWANKTFPGLENVRQQDPSPDELPDVIAVVARTITSGIMSQQELSLPDGIEIMARDFINSPTHDASALDDEIVRCFGASHTANLDRYPGGKGGGFSLHGNNASECRVPDLFAYAIPAAGQQSSIAVSIPDDTALRIGENIRLLAPLFLLLQEEQNEQSAYAFFDYLASDVVSNAAEPLNHPAHYLPADRAGVMHAHQVAVRGLIAGASRTVLRQDSPMPILSGVLGDFLDQLVTLASDSASRNRGEYDELALRLEQGLLRGTVRVERSQIDYPSFVYRPVGWERDLPLMNASSMVSELAPVALYLHRVVQPGETLIIEEPESHLHPAMQVEFTRLLAAAVKAGVRIIITTHSEWILEELANLVRLSDLPVEQRNGIPDADIDLSHDEVGAWFFEHDIERGGSVVREIPLDVESGTFPAGYGLITESLYKRWSTINRRVRKSQ